MQIVILLSQEVSKEISELILDYKLEGGYHIDYAFNSLMSYHNGKEVEIYNFSKFIQLDNRKGGYEIDDYGTKIVINFK